MSSSLARVCTASRGRPVSKPEARSGDTFRRYPMSPQRRRRTFLTATAVLLAVIALVLLPKLGPIWRHPVLAFRLLCATAEPTLPVPVRGVTRRQLRDTWNGPRSGGRKHRGIDIFAARNTPITSTTRGIVATVGTSELGGRIVRILGPAGEWHYYAHLERFASIREGDVVQAGTVVGYVGDSGNARGTPPHLHYGIYRYYGGAMNPYPRLAP
jgi:murein DD-endopeptidase MepM/ murein hydrolase activator NlpD